MSTHTPERHVYRRVIDPDGQDSLARIARLIRPGSQVLELGVATGYLSRYLAEEKACTVDGVELDPDMAREARPWCRNLVVHDLETADLDRWFPRRAYDAVVCADVLEHLRDPERVLRRVRDYLSPTGRLIVSVPNVAYSGILMALIQGDFPYRFEGLLDETHVRFFTHRTFRALLERTGFRVLSEERVFFPLERSEFAAHAESLDPSMREYLLGLSDAQTYQFIFEAAGPDIDRDDRAALPVDVIVPVYRGLETSKRCLQSLVDNPQQTPLELTVVDDASPEPGLRDYVAKFCRERGVRLLHNATNLGFVASVNRAMALHAERDVVLVNSDVTVHGDWLDRLVACAQTGADVGTVTPFTNNGTICGYPRFFAENRLPEGWDVAALDELFRQLNRRASVDIPTAVGFCMYIRRRCLEQTGLFDAAAFGRGYGEEVDFCRRASRGGFRHLLCADTFVYHAGGGSFGAQAVRLQERAQEVLNARYPDYVPLVEAHRRQDPARLFRRTVDLARLRLSAKPLVLFVIHYGGGGTEQHARDLARILADACEVLLLRPLPSAKVRLEWPAQGEEMALHFDLPREFSALCSVLKYIGIARIHFHHLLGHVPALMSLPRDLKLPYDYTIHDCYPVCPQYQMTDRSGRYCGEPDEAACNRCVTDRPSEWGLDIGSWRKTFETFLAGAERVIAPSRDTAARIERYLQVPSIRVVPHPEQVSMPDRVPVRRDSRDPVKVLVLGRLTPEKGADLLRECALLARRNGAPLFFRLLGYSTIPLVEEPDAALSVSGEYRHQDLPRLIQLERADIVFFPALWPETYSYTLSAAINSGLAIAAPNLGAFPERLAGHPAALLRAWDSSPEAWNAALLKFVSELSADYNSD